MKVRDFPSYRLRHAIRVWRTRRRYPWRFDPEAAPLRDRDERDEDEVLPLPPSDVFDRAPAPPDNP